MHQSLSGRCSSVMIGSVSGTSTAESLRIHSLKDRCGVLGGQAHVAADVEFPTADGFQRPLGRALAGEVSCSGLDEALQSSADSHRIPTDQRLLWSM